MTDLLISLALAIVAWAVHAHAKHPALSHLVRLLVLVKLVTPPVMTVPPVGVEGLDDELDGELIAAGTMIGEHAERDGDGK